MNRANMLLAEVLRLSNINDESHDNMGKTACKYCARKINGAGMHTHLATCQNTRKLRSIRQTELHQKIPCKLCGELYKRAGMATHLRSCGTL